MKSNERIPCYPTGSELREECDKTKRGMWQKLREECDKTKGGMWQN